MRAAAVSPEGGEANDTVAGEGTAPEMLRCPASPSQDPHSVGSSERRKGGVGAEALFGGGLESCTQPTRRLRSNGAGRKTRYPLTVKYTLAFSLSSLLPMISRETSHHRPLALPISRSAAETPSRFLRSGSRKLNFGDWSSPRSPLPAETPPRTAKTSPLRPRHTTTDDVPPPRHAGALEARRGVPAARCDPVVCAGCAEM